MADRAFEENYAKYYDFFNRGKDYTKEVQFLDSVFRKYGSARSILDLGCGTGLHDVLLASRGHKVTGLDLSESMINIANSRKLKNLDFVVGDMSDFSLGKRYNACISMFAAFGYLTENGQIESALESVKRHLNKSGLFVMECWNGLGVMGDLPTSRTKTAQSGNTRIERTSFPTLHASKHVCDVKFDVKIYEDDKLAKNYQELHHMRFLFPQEIRKYLEDSGFKVLETCRAFDLGQEVSEKDWNMVVVAKLKDAPDRKV